MVSWSKRKLYINDTYEISLGKILFVIIITAFQFMGLWAENNWVVKAGMFYLVANAFLSLSKSSKTEEEKRLMIAKENAEKIRSLENVIKICEGEIKRQSITEKELTNIIKGIEKKLGEGLSPTDIVEEIKNSDPKHD